MAGTCIVCQKPCTKPWEKNSDGTWAHDECLFKCMTPFLTPTKK